MDPADLFLFSYFFPNNNLFCSTFGTMRMVREMRGFVLKRCQLFTVEQQSILANMLSTTSVVTSRMPCRYLVYMSSLTTTRLLGISKRDANRRASSNVAVKAQLPHCKVQTNTTGLVTTYNTLFFP